MKRRGKLTAYVGTMGSGKTKKLISIYRKLVEQGKNVYVFKHKSDMRREGDEDNVVARNGDTAPAIPVSYLSEIVHKIKDGERVHAILIDEIQFFDSPNSIRVLEAMTYIGMDVYVFGLDLTSEFTTFGVMGDILARADDVKKLKCKCKRCGAPSRVSAYIGEDEKDGDVKVGDLDDYIPMCRQCYYDEMDMTDTFKVDRSLDGDELYEFDLVAEGFKVHLNVYKSELDAAGYTKDDVLDIVSAEGIENLLEDLGFIIGGEGYGVG